MSTDLAVRPAQAAAPPAPVIERPEPPPLRSLRARQTARVLVAGALVMASGALAGRVFARPVAATIAFAALPSIAITALDVFPRIARWLLHVLAIPVVAAVATALAGGRVPETTFEGLWRGWNLATSTDWPSPMRSELVAFAAAAVGLAAAVTVEIVRSDRWRAVGLIPPLVLGVLFVGLAAPDGPPPGAGVAVWLLLAGVVLLLSETSWGRPALGDELRNERRSLLLLVALAVIGGLSVSIAHRDDRADPRLAATNPAVSTNELNPLAQVAADRLLDPAEPRFTVAGPITGRWRTTVLDRFDGVNWTSSLTVRPVSPDRISPPSADGSATRQTVTVDGRSLVWLPVAGVPVTADRFVASDPDRSVLVADRPLVAGESITIATLPSPSRADVSPDATSRRVVGDEGAEFSALASTLSGTATTLRDRLDNIERALREDDRLAPDELAGTSERLLELALVQSKQATREQFVAGFVLMARSLGASARIAVGYEPPASGSVVTSADAVAWAEVYFDGVGWVPYDPVPTSTADERAPVGDAAEPEPVQLAPPPPANPPSPDDTPPEVPPAVPAVRSGWVATAVKAGSAVGGLVLLVGALAVTVVAVKSRRRRRRLNATEPRRLVLGAWAEATDHLVALGARLARYQTNAEIVLTASPLVPFRAAAPLGDLAALANGAAHGRDAPDPIVAAHAVRLLGQVEQAIGEGERRRTRWRRRLSLRPLRRSTRSPVH